MRTTLGESELMVSGEEESSIEEEILHLDKGRRTKL